MVNLPIHMRTLSILEQMLCNSTCGDRSTNKAFQDTLAEQNNPYICTEQILHMQHTTRVDLTLIIKALHLLTTDASNYHKGTHESKYRLRTHRAISLAFLTI